MKAFLSFYEEKYSIVIPETFEQFKQNICSIFQFPLTHFNELIICYNDSDGDKIIVGNDLDYNELKNQITKKEVNEIKLEVIEGSKLFVAKEMSKVKEKEPPVKKNEEDAGMLKQQNISSKQNPISNSDDKPILHQQPLIDNQPKVINPIPGQVELSKNSIKQASEIAFNFTCAICKVSPIKEIMYLCKECKLHICSDCEEWYGYDHPHPYLKIRTKEMLFGNESNVYSNSEIKQPNQVQPAKLKENADNILDSIKKIPGIIKNFFNDGIDEDEERQRKITQAIQTARHNYDLRNISDEQILSALFETKGNLEQAVILLASNDKQIK